MASSSYDRRTRGRFRVHHVDTDETLGIFFNDEGYRSMDLPMLKTLFPEYNKWSLRVTGVTWPDFGEVVIQVKGKKVEPKSGSGV